MHSTSIQALCVHHDPELQRGIEDCYACLAFNAMGSRFEILLAKESGRSSYEMQAIAEDLRDLVLDWHSRLSVFESSSITSMINRAPPGVPVVLDEDMFSLCELCERLRIQTNGAFNIAAGTLMHAHGFRGGIQEVRTVSLQALNLEHAITLDRQTRSIMREDIRVSIDFGAIAKGFVLDQMRVELEGYGVANAFIHGGTSSVLAIGLNHNTNPWIAQLSQSYRLALSGHAVGVSEYHSQVPNQGTHTHGHIMDPSSNQPVDNSVNQIVCVHTNAASADAYSTACCVNPLLADDICAEPCTIIVADSSPIPTIYDPLGVVHSQGHFHDRS